MTDHDYPSDGDLRVAPVRSRRDERLFLEIPFEIYRKDPFWVAPLLQEERKRWSPRHNASLESRWVERFLAWRGSRVVGRVAAIEDPTFTSRWRPGAGFFGFFECEENSRTAHALFEAAEEALRKRGLKEMLGPVHLSTHDEVGFLVEGFERRPAMLTPYNPAYYLDLAQENRLTPEAEFHAYLWTPESRPSKAVERLIASLRRRSGYFSKLNLRRLRSADWDDEMDRLFGLYNACFEDVWGFTPITRKEFAQRSEAFKPFHRPEGVLFAEVEGQVVGFALVLPDINEVLGKMNGKLFPFGWLHLLRQVPRIQTARFLLMGVLPEFAGRGIAPMLAVEMTRIGDDLGTREVELSLVLGTNRRIQRVIEGMGCDRLKTYRLYGKELTATESPEVEDESRGGG